MSKRPSQRQLICPQIDFMAEGGEIITKADKTAQKAQKKHRRGGKEVKETITYIVGVMGAKLE